MVNLLLTNFCLCAILFLHGGSMNIDREKLTARMCQLMLQDYYGYLSSEKPEHIIMYKAGLEGRIKELETRIPLLEKEYRTLVNDKTTDNEKRMEVNRLKMELSLEVEKIKDQLGNDNACIIKLREIYSRTLEAVASRREQREIVDLLWK